MRDDVVELVLTQGEIIKLQQTVIDSLFCSLSQHVSIGELEDAIRLDALTCAVTKMEELKSRFGDVCGE